MAQTVEEFERAILAFVAENDRCTFPELVEAIPDSEGEYVAELPNRNVLLWGSMAVEMTRALSRLFHGHKLFYVPAQTLLPYIAVGQVMTLPLVGSVRGIDKGYVKPRWLPVLLSVHHPIPKRAAADFAAWAKADAERAARKGGAHGNP